MSKIYSVFTGTGSYVPTKQVKNEHFNSYEFYDSAGEKLPTLNDDIRPNVLPARNIIIIAIRVEKRPLQGIKLLVIIAINLSCFDSIILHPVTPQALQPIPIAIVRLCFPCAPHFEKNLSRLNAILGKYPKSSIIEKRGKKIAIGGNITETTHVRVVYIPSIKNPVKKSGILNSSNKLYKSVFNISNK